MRVTVMTLSDLSEQMREKSDQQLQEMFARASEWSPEALEVAKAELQRRGIPIVIVSVQAEPDKIYELLPNGRKRYLKATGGDIIISSIAPGWGLIIGALAFLIKGEKKRGTTMMIIGAIVLLLLIVSGRLSLTQ